MDRLELKNEIDNGPLASEFIGKSDNEVADILNDTSRFTSIKSRYVTARTFLAELPNGAEILDKLEVAASNISTLKWALRFLQLNSGVDIGHPNSQAQITALGSYAILTEDEANAIKNMALQPTSRAELLGWPTISYNDVNAARAM